MKQFLIRDNSGKVYSLFTKNTETAYKQYAVQVLKLDVSKDFDTGDVDVDLVEVVKESGKVLEPFAEFDNG